MATFTRSDLFQDEIRKLVEEEIARLAEEMAFGQLKSFEADRHGAGKIAGLRSCLEYIEEAAVSVNKKLS